MVSDIPEVDDGIDPRFSEDSAGGDATLATGFFHLRGGGAGLTSFSSVESSVSSGGAGFNHFGKATGVRFTTGFSALGSAGVDSSSSDGIPKSGAAGSSFFFNHLGKGTGERLNLSLSSGEGSAMSAGAAGGQVGNRTDLRLVQGLFTL